MAPPIALDTIDDPLQSSPSTSSSAPSTNIPNPLTDDDGNTFTDPLSARGSPSPMSARGDRRLSMRYYQPSLITARTSSDTEETFLNWKKQKNQILKKYTTDQQMPVTSNIIDEEDEEDEEQKKFVNASDRIQQRLAQLEKGSQIQVSYMTQKQMIKHVENLNSALKNHWARNNRVESLKIVIKCAKFLGRNNVPQFYPSLFVLVAEVLDTFGSLVYQRIVEKSNVYDESGRLKSKLPPTFTPEDVPQHAKETCNNWFYKVASIRELLPRFFVEVAILKCRLFLSNDKANFQKILMRIAATIRGIGDPLIAMYARCFLARKTMDVLPDFKDHLMLCYNDFLLTQSQFSSSHVQKTIKRANMTMNQYLDLYAPGLQWLLESIGYNAGEKEYNMVLEKYQAQCNQLYALNAIVAAFEANIIANSASLIIFLINETDDKSISKAEIFKTLGRKFAVCPPSDHNKLQLLNEVWKPITKLENLKEYLQVAEIFIEFVVKNYSNREVNILLGDIRRHVSQILQLEDDVTNSVRNILLCVLEYNEDFRAVFTMDNLMPLMDLLSASSKIDVCKGILQVFINEGGQESDAIIINAMFDIARSIHDSIYSLTSDEEKSYITNLICEFILKVEFGLDFEHQLNFYTECRSVFLNLQIQETLVHQVLLLAHRTHKLVKGKHNKRTLTFVKACLSFAHISIPSIEDEFAKLRLFVVAGQCALVNNLLPQADTLFRHVITAIPEVPLSYEKGLHSGKPTHPELSQFLCEFLSALVCVPGHPEFGPLYLVTGLLNVVAEYPWPNGCDAKIKVYAHCLAALSAFYQKSGIPYKYAGVATNNELFLGDESYSQEIVSLGNSLIDKILEESSALSKDNDVNSRRTTGNAYAVALNVLVSFSDLRPSKMVSLLKQLYRKAKDADVQDVNAMLDNTLNYLANNRSPGAKELRATLL